MKKLVTEGSEFIMLVLIAIFLKFIIYRVMAKQVFSYLVAPDGNGAEYQWDAPEQIYHGKQAAQCNGNKRFCPILDVGLRPPIFTYQA